MRVRRPEHVSWRFATSQLVCVERCSQPERVGKAHATSQLVCVSGVHDQNVSEKPTPPRSLPASSGVHNQNVVSEKPTPPRSLSAWSGVSRRRRESTPAAMSFPRRREATPATLGSRRDGTDVDDRTLGSGPTAHSPLARAITFRSGLSHLGPGLLFSDQAPESRSRLRRLALGFKVLRHRRWLPATLLFLIPPAGVPCLRA